MLIVVLKKIRNMFLVKIKWRRYSIARGFHAGRGVVLWCKNKLSIGENCYIGRNTMIECDAVIGKNVLIANNVALVGKYDHDYTESGVPMRFTSNIRSKDYSWKGLNSCVVIEDDVWLGYGSIVLSGVKVGKGSIVAAGAVVTKDVSPYVIVAGNPARVVGKRFNAGDIEKHEMVLNNYKKNR